MLPARLIKAQAEQEAAEKLMQASQDISKSPLGLELRRMRLAAADAMVKKSVLIRMIVVEFRSARPR